MPLISIIVPVHDAAASLSATIESVQAQEFADWEMVIVDDCSYDATVRLVERYILHDPRIRLIRRAESEGLVAARNVGLTAAQGQYVTFMDAGDRPLPQKLGKQLAFMREHQATISCTAYRFFHDPEKPQRVRKVLPRTSFDTLLHRNRVQRNTVMIDRAVTGPVVFDTQGERDTDFSLWLNLTKAGHDILGLNEDMTRLYVPQDKPNPIRRAWQLWRSLRDIAGLPRKEAFWALVWHILF